MSGSKRKKLRKALRAILRLPPEQPIPHKAWKLFKRASRPSGAAMSPDVIRAIARQGKK